MQSKGMLFSFFLFFKIKFMCEDEVSVVIFEEMEKEGVNIREHLVVPSDKTGMLALVEKIFHLGTFQN